MLRNWASILSIAFLCAIPTVSRADTVYDVTGTFGGGPTLGGTYTISAAGVVTAADLTINGISFTDITFSTAPSNALTDTTTYTETLIGDGTTGDYLDLFISGLDTVCTTVNKNSCTDTNTITNHSYGNFSDAYVSTVIPYQLNLISGSATPEGSPATTPEPSSLALLGTGLVGAFAVGRRKFFKA